MLLSSALMDRRTGNSIVLNGKVTDTSRVDAEALEREIRTGLPVGSSLATVQEFFSQARYRTQFPSIVQDRLWDC